MNPKIYILLPVHNRIAVTEQFIQCLLTQTYSNYHLILIDDGSTDGTDEMVAARIANLTVIHGKGDWWWAGSLQQGLEWLKHAQIEADDLILFINDDVRFLADYLSKACKVMQAKKNTLVLSRLRRPITNEVVETGIFADLQVLTFEVAQKSADINCLSTRGLFVYWKDVLSIGDFHPQSLPHYLSDYEYTIRAHKKGFSCETSEDLLIELNEETTGYHKIKENKFGEFLLKYFSKKSANNPCYWTIFIFLTSPPIYLIPNLIKIWIRATKSIIRAFIFSKIPCARP